MNDSANEYGLHGGGIPSVSSEGVDLARSRRGKAAQQHRPTTGRLPPQEPQAEQGCLGCCLLSPNDCVNALEERGCCPDWFYDLRHGMIWHRLAEMQKTGQAIDVITLQAELKKSGELEQIGGIQYLASLPDIGIGASFLSAYADIVEEKFKLRKLLASCADITSQVYEFEGDVDSLFAQVTRDVLKLSEASTQATEERIKTIILRVIDEWEDYHRGHAQIRGLTTGLEYLDKLLLGFGGKKANDVVISGRPGSGKTSLAMQIAKHVALKHVWWEPVLDANRQPVMELVDGREKYKCDRKVGLPVGVFSLEMTREALVERMMFQESGADMQRWRTGFAEEDAKRSLVMATMKFATPNNIFIDDDSRCTMEKLRARARRMHRQHGIKLFVVDYIQLMKAGGKKRYDNRNEELTYISSEFQALGKELQVPFIIIAQMNRDYDKEPNRKPRLSDLKDCGAIEQDADIVLFTYKAKLKDEEEEFYDEIMVKHFGEDWSKYPVRTNLLVAKNRYGISDRDAQCLFEGSCTRFTDWNQWLKDKGCKAPAAGEPKQRSMIDDEDVANAKKHFEQQ